MLRLTLLSGLFLLSCRNEKDSHFASIGLKTGKFAKWDEKQCLCDFTERKILPDRSAMVSFGCLDEASDADVDFVMLDVEPGSGRFAVDPIERVAGELVLGPSDPSVKGSPTEVFRPLWVRTVVMADDPQTRLEDLRMYCEEGR